MKKISLLFSGLMMGFYGFSQLPVSTTPENRKALLEEFTGLNCTFCPDGHVIAGNLKATHGNNLYIIKVHAGGFANPGGGQPDFRTPFGNGLVGQADVTGYPAGTVNRQVFAGSSQGSGTAMGRGNWSNAVTNLLSQSAYVNVAVEAEVDEQTRELTVTVQYHYTDDSPEGTNKLNVALIQHNIEGPQSGAESFNASNILPNGNYNHTYMLRHLLSGQFGDDITSTTQGSTATEVYTYIIPPNLNGVEYVLGNLEVVAFVAEGQQDVINVAGTAVDVTNHEFNLDASVNDLESLNDLCEGTASQSMWVKVTNHGATTINSMDFEYSANGGTASSHTWNGTLGYAQSTYITLPAISFTVQATNSLDIEITAVNGGADDVAANNLIAGSFNEAATGGNNVYVEVFTDNYPGETTWEIRSDNNSLIASGSYQAGPGQAGSGGNDALTLHQHLVDLQNAGCFKVTIFDSWGDGMTVGGGQTTYLQIKEYGTNNILAYIPGNFSDEALRFWSSDGSINGANVEENMQEAIQLYPNPANNKFTLDFNDFIANGQVEIMDMQGKIVRTINIDNVNTYSVDVTDFESGLYFVNINIDGKVQTKKVTVNK